MRVIGVQGDKGRIVELTVDELARIDGWEGEWEKRRAGELPNHVEVYGVGAFVEVGKVWGMLKQMRARVSMLRRVGNELLTESTALKLAADFLDPPEQPDNTIAALNKGHV